MGIVDKCSDLEWSVVGWSGVRWNGVKLLVTEYLSLLEDIYITQILLLIWLFVLSYSFTVFRFFFITVNRVVCFVCFCLILLLHLWILLLPVALRPLQFGLGISITQGNKFIFSQLQSVELIVEILIFWGLQKSVLNIGQFVTFQIPIQSSPTLLIIKTLTLNPKPREEF